MSGSPPVHGDTQRFTPVFIIGCGRSGSTLLYKMLSLHPDIGFISNWEARFPGSRACMLLGRLTRSHYALNLWSWFDGAGHANTRMRSLLRKVVPTPVEGEPLYRRCGVTLNPVGSDWDAAAVRRLRSAFQRLGRLRNTPIVLSKRTRNLHRLALLEAAFPEARYIGIVRDGRAVTDSAVKAPWWSRAARAFAAEAGPEVLSSREVALRVVGRSWARNMDLFEQARARIGPSRFKLVVYEDLLTDRCTTLRSLLNFCGASEDEGFFRAVDCIRLSNRVAWRSTWPKSLQAEITAVQRPHLERYGYTG